MGERVSIVSALEEIDRRSVVERVWSKDHTLWGSDPACAADRMGWLAADRWIGPRLDEIERLTAEVSGEGVDSFILIGMGGSVRAARAISGALGTRPGHARMIPTESTVPEQIRAALDGFDPARSLAIVSSKSGRTAETLAIYAVVRDIADRALGRDRAGRRFVAITDPGTPLAHLAAGEGFRTVLYSDPAVVGRFSALTHYGLVPAALIGADIGALIESGASMRERCRPGRPAESNPAAVLGARITAAAAAGIDKLTLITSPALSALSPWIVQLVAESLGKRGKGVIPVAGEPLASPEHYGADRLFVHTDLAGDSSEETTEFLRNVADAGHPVMTSSLGSGEALGGEFFRWEMAVAIAAALIGVNPFDQPDVQRSREGTENILSAGAEDLPDSLAADTGDTQDLTEMLSAGGPGDYLALLAFLPHSPATEAALDRLRTAAVTRCGLATMVGLWPRVHSRQGTIAQGRARQRNVRGAYSITPR